MLVHENYLLSRLIISILQLIKSDLSSKIFEINLTESIACDNVTVKGEKGDMNERLRAVRKALNLNQKEFGAKIGITDAAISKLESGQNRLTKQAISAICREFNVNYEWLTTGTGEMFTSIPQNIFDALCDQYELDEFDRSLVREYLKLDARDRRILKDYIRNVLKPVDDTQARIDREVEEYRRQLELEASRAERSSYSAAAKDV